MSGILEFLNDLSNRLYSWQPAWVLAVLASAMLVIAVCLTWRELSRTMRAFTVIISLGGLSLSVALTMDVDIWNAYLMTVAALVAIGLAVFAYLWSRDIMSTYEQNAVGRWFVAHDLTVVSSCLLVSVSFFVFGNVADAINFNPWLVVACNLIALVIACIGVGLLTSLWYSTQQHRELMQARAAQDTEQEATKGEEPIDRI